MNGSVGTKEYVWQPIGDGDDCFQGHYNGGGHTIGNIYYKDVSNVGIFGTIATATIDSVTIVGPVGFANPGKINYCGMLVGRTDKGAMGGTLSHCRNQASFTITTDKAQYIGGLVGLGKKLVMHSCSNEGDITVTTTASTENDVYVGGLIGSISVASDKLNYSVDSCYNRGHISLECNYTTDTVTCKRYVGGIIGYDKGNTSSGNMELAFCYSNAMISVTVTGAKYINGMVTLGGLVGYSKGGELRNSYSHTCFSLSNLHPPAKLGCIIGEHETSKNHGWVRNCYYGSSCSCLSQIGSTGKTDDEMKSQDFVDLINTDTEKPFVMDDKDENDGFPILYTKCRHRVTIRTNNDAWGTVAKPIKREP